jgi:ABC-type nickel/cobalt efflux system permease component RcnA
MASVLLLGVLIGMQHALEADHIAAVATIASRQRTARRIIAHGAVWGIGHTITLMAFAGGAVLLGKSIGADMAGWLERGVGVMLVLLGGSVLYRLWRERIHYHVHRHADGVAHFHAHAHSPDTPHDRRAHAHDHPQGLPYRTLLVGMMHGMAGSAALLVLTASSVVDPVMAFFYIFLFGAGSIVGMALLSGAIAVPLHYTARALTWGHRVVQGVIGVGTMVLGGAVLAGV